MLIVNMNINCEVIEMKKITGNNLKRIDTGTALYDKVSHKIVKVTKNKGGGFFEIGMLIETAESLKRCYMLLD